MNFFTDKTRRSSENNHETSILNRTAALPDYDGVVYTLDAKLLGNIGRYFNHSCSPNIAVQNVFVDVRTIDVTIKTDEQKTAIQTTSPHLSDSKLIFFSIFRHMIFIFHGLVFLQPK